MMKESIGAVYIPSSTLLICCPLSGISSGETHNSLSFLQKTLEMHLCPKKLLMHIACWFITGLSPSWEVPAFTCKKYHIIECDKIISTKGWCEMVGTGTQGSFLRFESGQPIWFSYFLLKTSFHLRRKAVTKGASHAPGGFWSLVQRQNSGVLYRKMKVRIFHDLQQGAN